MNQAVDAVFNFDERSEVGEIADAALHGHADREFLMQRIPGIRCQLPHTKRNAALDRVYVDDDALDFVAHIDELGWMLHALGPGHLADVNQAFDSLLKLDERAVVGDADYAAANMRADGITMLGIKPRIRGELLESERSE